MKIIPITLVVASCLIASTHALLGMIAGAAALITSVPAIVHGVKSLINQPAAAPETPVAAAQPVSPPAQTQSMRSSSGIARLSRIGGSAIEDALFNEYSMRRRHARRDPYYDRAWRSRRYRDDFDEYDDDEFVRDFDDEYHRESRGPRRRRRERIEGEEDDDVEDFDDGRHVSDNEDIPPPARSTRRGPRAYGYFRARERRRGEFNRHEDDEEMPYDRDQDKEEGDMYVGGNRNDHDEYMEREIHEHSIPPPSRSHRQSYRRSSSKYIP